MTLYEWVIESLTHLILQTADSFRNKASDSLRMSHWIIDSLDFFKRPIHSETKQVTLYEWVSESLTHLISSNGRFIQKQSKWLFTNEPVNHWLTWVLQTADSFRNKASDSLRMSQWIIDSLDFFKRPIHSETKQVTLYEWVIESLTHLISSNGRFIQKQSKWLFTNESVNLWLTWFLQTADSFRNKASDSLRMSQWIIDSLDFFKRLIHSETKQVTLYEWVIESLIHLISSNGRFIQKQSKWLFTNESVNHWLTWFLQTADSFRNKASDSLRMSHWIIDSLISSNGRFIQKQSKWLFTNESLNHWLTWFLQTADSFRNKASDSLRMSQWIFDSLDFFKRPIHSETKQVTLRMSQWIIDSLDFFKRLIHSETKQVTLYEWVIESLIHLISSNGRFIQKQSKWLFTNESVNHWLTWFLQTADSFRNKASDSLRMSHWIIDSLDFFKRPIHSETKQVTLYEWVIESLTHLISFKRPIHSETKQVTLYEWVSESLTHLILQTADSFRNKASDSLRMSQWIIDSLEFFKRDSFRNKASDSLRMSHWIIDSLDFFKRPIHSETKQVTLYEWVSESLTHLISSNGWFIQKQSKWLFTNESLNHWFTWFLQTADSFRNKASDSLRMSQWIIDSLDFFKRPIHSETKQVTLYEWVIESLTHLISSNGRFIQKQSKWLFTNESLNHWLTWFLQTADSFKQSKWLFTNESVNLTHLISSNGRFIRNKASDSYEWVSESLTHLSSSNGWFIQKQSKWLFTNESLNHWFTWFLQTADSFRNKASDSLRMSQWSWLTWFLQTADSFRNKASDSLRMSHWIIDSLDFFKRPIHSETKQVALYEWVIESLTHLISSNGWFIQKQSKWMNHWLTRFVQTADSFRNKASEWMNHWIIDSLDLFKQLIHSKTKWVNVNESLIKTVTCRHLPVLLISYLEHNYFIFFTFIFHYSVNVYSTLCHLTQ